MTEHQTTATVETLTAEVHVLKVGNRQITRSVYLQLDSTLPDCGFHAFGRVRSGSRPSIPGNILARATSLTSARSVELVGRDNYSGALVRSHAFYFDCDHAFGSECGCGEWVNGVRQPPTVDHWLPHDRYTMGLISLPLIVLAGLR